MHLLVFEQCPDSGLGGQERSLFEVCKGLAARGAKITLVHGEDGNLLPPYAEFCEKIIQAPIPYFIRPPNALKSISSLINLARHSRSAGWDALYINQYMDSPLASLLGILTRKPLFCHLRQPFPQGRLSRQFKFGLRRCQLIMANSQFTKHQFVDGGIDEAKIEVVYNGVDLKYFSPRSHEGRGSRNIIYLGRICPTKGIETLIEAYASIAKKRDDITMTISGNPIGRGQYSGYRETLRQKANEAGVRINFLDHQPDVRPLLETSDLLVLPSNCGESFGRVLIEAMAMGIPVVATRDGGIPEVLSRRFDAHLVTPGEPNSLAVAILNFIDWRTDKPGLGSEFRHYVESRFSQTQTHDQIFSLISDSISKANVGQKFASQELSGVDRPDANNH